MWGARIGNPNKKISEYEAFQFSRQHAGVIFKQTPLRLARVLNVSGNKSNVSNLQVALDSIDDSSEVNEEYFGTLSHGLDVASEQKLVTSDKIDNLKTKLMANGSNAIPAQQKPLKEKREMELCKVLGKTFIAADKDKAPGKKLSNVYKR